MFSRMIFEVLLNNDFNFKLVCLCCGSIWFIVIDLVVVVLVGVLIVVKIKVNGSLIFVSRLVLSLVMIVYKIIMLIVRFIIFCM